MTATQLESDKVRIWTKVCLFDTVETQSWLLVSVFGPDTKGDLVKLVLD